MDDEPKTHRVIYELAVTWQEGRMRPIVHLALDRRGRSTGWTRCRPRNKTRWVDLRVGDQFLWNGEWKTVVKLRPEKAELLTEAEAVKLAATDGIGYVYRMTGEAPPTPRKKKHAYHGYVWIQPDDPEYGDEQ